MRLPGLARALGLSNVPIPDDLNPTQSPFNSSEISNVKAFSGGRSVEARRSELRKASQETLDAIQQGRYEFHGKTIDLKVKTQESCKSTKFYGPDSVLKQWATLPATAPSSPTHISVLQISTLEAARLLDDMRHNNRKEAGNVIVGVLNFASALKPGGGFSNGSDGQEQSIARASTLHSALVTSEAQQFYKLHGSQNNDGYFSHGIVYSPKITVFRDDDGRWTSKFEIDVLSCAAVNVNLVLSKNTKASKAATMVSIEKEMKDRMGRILFLFERNGVKDIILGAFGTGSFYNDIATVARLWAELLVVPSARFKKSFDRVIFAIMGKPTYDLFNNAFIAWGGQDEVGNGSGSEDVPDFDSDSDGPPF